MADASLVGRATSATSTVATAAGSVSTGDALAAVFSYDPGVTISSISDTAGNTYVQRVNETAGNANLALYTVDNATGNASNVLTVTFSGAAFAWAALVKITGAATAAYDSAATASGQDSNTPFEITSGTLSQADSVVISGVEINQNGGTGAFGCNHTILDSEVDSSNFWAGAVSKQVVASTSAVTPSWTKVGETSPAVRGIFVAAFKASGSDTTSPTLTSPTSASTGQTTGQGTVSTDEANGTMYSVVSTSVTAPSVAQIQAGNDSTGSAAAWSGNQAIASTGVKTFNATGLTSSTAYYFHFQHRDAATNDSTVSTSAQFTTDAPAAGYRTAWLRA